MTITGSTTLHKDEVERMVKEAESHAEEDRRKAEAIETKNRAEHLAFQAEKALKDAGDKVPSDLRTDIEGKIAAVRDAISKNDDAAIKSAHDTLQASIQKIGEAVYASAGERVVQRAGRAGAGSGRRCGSRGRCGRFAVRLRRVGRRRRGGRRVQGGLSRKASGRAGGAGDAPRSGDGVRAP